MNLLAIDTATEACSVALLAGTDLLLRHEVAGRSHTQRLMPLLQELMAQAGLRFAQLDAYVCGIGPGSFAGVRIGLSFVKGLALAHERPTLGVCSLEALAAAAMQDGATRVISAIDARMNEVYVAAYERDDAGLPRPLREPQVAAPADVQALPGSWHAVGSGWGPYAAALGEATQAQLLGIDAAALPRADLALRIAAPRLRAAERNSAASLQPLYLRNKVALTLAEQQARR